MKRKLLTLTTIALLSAGAFGAGGCANLLPGNDPVVVNAERSTAVTVETINTFLKLEYDNHVPIAQHAPQIHQYANYVRIHAPDWIASARTLTRTYKQHRSPENKANLQTALATLAQVIAQIQQYTMQINGLQP